MSASGPSTSRAHFNHAGASTPPESVVDRVVAHLRLEVELGGYEAADAVADEADAIPSALAALIGAEPSEVVAVESATRAWELILWALAHSHRWGSGDRIVVDQFAYASCWATLMRLGAVTGIEVVVAPAQADGSIDPDQVAATVDERTRMLLATHVPTHLGTVSDVVAVGAALSGHDLVYAVDVSQSLGQLPLDVTTIGCQVAFAPGRKFLRAPRGTGLLYVADAVAESVSPLGLDTTSTTTLEMTSFELQPGARRFETFEHSLALRLGLAEAARHALAIGWDDIAKAVGERTAEVVELVAARPGLDLVAQPPLSGIVSFTHETVDPDQVVGRLGELGVSAWVAAVGGSPVDQARRDGRPAVRLSPHYVTTEADLAALDRALREIA